MVKNQKSKIKNQKSKIKNQKINKKINKKINVKNQCKKCKLKNLFSILQPISVSQIIVKVQSSIQV